MNLSSLQWTSVAYKPVVLVIASAKADEICLKNGTTLSEMLKPFGARLGGKDGAVRFRTPAQGLKVVRGYGVQMISPSEMNRKHNNNPANTEQDSQVHQTHNHIPTTHTNR